MAFCLSCTLGAAASEQPQQRRRHGTDAALVPPLGTTMDLALRASTAARPHLIDVLNSSAMRARLGPPMASWTAEALLRAVDDVASSAEVLHVTSAGASLFGATSLYGTRLPDSETHEHLARDALYPGLFRSRPVYTALNLIGASTGAPWYGDVSLVLSPAYFAEHGRCVPADSGKLFDCCILKSASCKISAPRLRCEGVVQTPVGRPGALHHTLLASFRFWRDQPRMVGPDHATTNIFSDLLLARRPRFGRLGRHHEFDAGRAASTVGGALTGALSPTSTGAGAARGTEGGTEGGAGKHERLERWDLLWEPYVECTVAQSSARDHISNTVKLAVARFAPLFGTADGASLRTWALHSRVALAWALEDAHDGKFSWYERNATAYVSGHRQLDPTSATRYDLDPTSATSARRGGGTPSPTSASTASATALASAPASASALLNVSVGASVVRAFDQLWAAAAAARAESATRRGDGPRLTREQTIGFWRDLTSLMPSDTRVHVPHPGACSDWTRCIGQSQARGGNKCVCYHSR